MSLSAILLHFYPDDTPLRRLLVRHSEAVRDKAVALAEAARGRGVVIDVDVVADGAMLHDIGICACHAPGIFCEGDRPYIAHGIIGAAMLRRYGREHGLDLEPYARICERHTGAGITAQEVVAQGLPIPAVDYLPVTMEEKAVCVADKFFSKSGDGGEKTVSAARRSLEKFGEATLARFDTLCALFQIQK